MSERLFTFELSKDGDELELHLNEDGLSEFIDVLKRLKKSKGHDHDHLMTPSWGGDQLTERKQQASNTLINHVSIHVWRV